MIGRTSGVADGVTDGVGVSDGVGLGVTGVLVGIGRGVCVAGFSGKGVCGDGVGDGVNGVGVQVGGMKFPSPRSIPKFKAAVGMRVGMLAARTILQPLSTNINRPRPKMMNK